MKFASIKSSNDMKRSRSSASNSFAAQGTRVATRPFVREYVLLFQNVFDLSEKFDRKSVMKHDILRSSRSGYLVAWAWLHIAFDQRSCK